MNQLEVAPLKNKFFLAVLKLYMKDYFGYNKEIERMTKTFPTITYIQTLASMYFININIT